MNSIKNKQFVVTYYTINGTGSSFNVNTDIEAKESCHHLLKDNEICSVSWGIDNNDNTVSEKESMYFDDNGKIQIKITK